MARTRRATTTGARAARFDALCEFWRRAPASVVVGLTLADAWELARREWPDLAASHDPGDEACVVEVCGTPVMLIAAGFDVPTFVHEAVHVAAIVLTGRGVPFTADNDETVAHTVEWVVRELLPAAQAWPTLSAEASTTSLDATSRECEDEA